MGSSFKIMLFNIEAGVSVTRGYWQYITSSWKYFIKHSFDFEKLTKYIEEERVDIAALIETSNTLRFSDNSELCQKLTGFKHNESVDYRLWKIFRLGNCLATRYKIILSVHNQLPAAREKRPLTEILLDVDGSNLKVILTHLSLVRRERTAQILFIKEYVKKIKGPLVLAADFNTDNLAELSPLLEVGLQRVSLPSYPAWKPSRKLDSLFINDKLFLIKSWTAPILISDHLPIVAELKFIDA